MTTRPTPWQRIQSYIWLVCGVGCLLAALIFWAITDTDALVEIENLLKPRSIYKFSQRKWLQRIYWVRLKMKLGL